MNDFEAMMGGTKRFSSTEQAPADESRNEQANSVADFIAGASASTGITTVPEDTAPAQEPAVEQIEPAVETIQPTVEQDVEETKSEIGESTMPLKEIVNVGSSIPFKFAESDELECNNFVNGYDVSLKSIACMADSDLLSTYMTSMERSLGVTLSFEAYGIDPIVFDDLKKRQGVEDGVVTINYPAEVDSDGVTTSLASAQYEMLSIDGKLYLSCVSDVLDDKYLKSVVAQGMEALTMHNEFIYTYVGPRPILVPVPGGTEYERRVIETLKLNTKELSILLSCMKSVEGVQYYSAMVDGHSCMVFTRK